MSPKVQLSTLNVKQSLLCTSQDCHCVNVTFKGLAEGVSIVHIIYHSELSTPLKASAKHHIPSDDINMHVDQTYGLTKRKTNGIYLHF